MHPCMSLISNTRMHCAPTGHGGESWGLVWAILVQAELIKLDDGRIGVARVKVVAADGAAIAVE